jgi:uncharacterized membrane protein
MNTNVESGKKLEQQPEGFDSPRLIKSLAWILLAAVIGLLSVLGSYWAFFDGGIIVDHQRWGTFGDYVGGVLNPFFGLLTILALLLTIVLQNRQLEISKQELMASRKELELTREELAKTAAAAQKQAEHFEGEAKRADLLRLIEKLADRINRNYNENRLDDASSLHRVMRGDRDPTRNVDLLKMLAFYKQKHSSTYDTIRWIEADCERLAAYISQYEQVSKYGGTPIPDFFRAEFGDMVNALYQYQMVSAELFDFYCYRPDTRE